MKRRARDLFGINNTGRDQIFELARVRVVAEISFFGKHALNNHGAFNAGQVGDVVVDKVKGEKGNVGYNAEKDKYEDLIEAGVIDPAKVTRTALQNAASISSLLLTTESLITDLPEENKSAAPAMPPGGMGGGMY